MDARRCPLVFIIGDLILDRYVEGKVTHIAPDAPVPVFVEEAIYYKPGGMWNVALNLHATGAKVFTFGVAGDDSIVDMVGADAFRKKHLFTLKVPSRRTHIKTRYLGQYLQQVLRVDIPKDGPISVTTQHDLLTELLGMVEREGQPDGIFIADYGCGVVTGNLISALKNLFPETFLMVDPYPTQEPTIYQGVDLVKLNRGERQNFERKLGSFKMTDLFPVVIETRGNEAVLIQRAGEQVEVTVPQRELVDACGAGDSFAAYLMTAILHDQSLEEAVSIAAHAGACCISHRGVHVVTPDEVAASMAACSKNTP